MNGTGVTDWFGHRPNAARHGQVMTTADLRDASPEALIGYIVGRHHARVRRVAPSILAKGEEAAQTDGVRHPELSAVADRTACLIVDLLLHMEREDTIVFPYIGQLAAAIRNHRPPPYPPIGSLDALIADVERDHDVLFDAMASVRELTDGYTAPADAGPACRTLMKNLAAFERALGEHLQIEREMLFPKIRALAAPALN